MNVYNFIFKKDSITIAADLLLFLITGLIPYQQQLQLHHFAAYAGAGGVCIEYDQSENTIIITCDASFREVVQAINDQSILEQLGDGGGEYLLKAGLQVDDGTTFSIGSNDITWLKIADDNGIVVHGRILINSVKITSWDASANDVIQQNSDGSIRRAFIQFDASEGSEIINSEFAYLGYQELGKRGFDLWGPDASYSGEGSSHDMVIRGSKFHNMWFAFYSRGAYNIVVDRNEYHHNIKYALDPHSGTRDMNITNNYLHHNPIGAICSDRCSNILIEGNRDEHNTKAGIFFSRNMHDSIARNNYIYNTSSGIIVSESPNNQIYSDTIEGASRAGILLFNPPEPDDGFTEGNYVFNNTISNSEDGIREIRSDGNILEDNKFFNIESDDE